MCRPRPLQDAHPPDEAHQFAVAARPQPRGREVTHALDALPRGGRRLARPHLSTAACPCDLRAVTSSFPFILSREGYTALWTRAPFSALHSVGFQLAESERCHGGVRRRQEGEQPALPLRPRPRRRPLQASPPPP